MAHRNFLSSISEMNRDQVRNSFNPESHSPLENGPCAFPVDNVAVNVVNYVPYINAPLRPIEYPSSSMEIPHYRSTTSGNSDMHQHHLSTASSSSFVPFTYAQQGPFGHGMIPRDEGRNMNPHVDGGRRALKRKSPSIPMFSDTGNTNRYYHNGSSSNITVSADLQQKPFASAHPWYWGPSGSVHNHSNGLLVSGEGSQRNVRSRHAHTPHLDAHLVTPHFVNNLPCHFPQVGDFPGPSVNGQWSHNPMSNVSHGRTPPGSSGFSHINQSFVSSTASVPVEPRGNHHHNIIPSRHLGAPLPVIHGPSQSMGEGQHNSHQRIGLPHGSTTCYPNLLFVATTSEEIGQSGPGAFSRHSRPLSIGGGHIVERNGRPRVSYGRFQSYSDDNSTRGRWMSEGVLMMDQSTFYDSVNLDQHRDMRLDIDNMSYEELLALEERIGNVNTGLSEDVMSKCVMKTIYCSSDLIQDLEEQSCVICLESYEDKDELGRLKCGHDYHVDCIKRWLLMKNVCPICKSSVPEDASKE
uniref:RING-type E3 ubiquitin transferase n=1 Tax=Anthurium amnicola TaxID=1678845 RepID=A0A1D1Y0M2_9ARAE